MYKNVIFDFNGTLLDDRQVCLDILNKLCDENNLANVTMEEYREVFNFPVAQYYKKVGFNIDDDSFKNVGERFHEYYNVLSYKEAFLYENVKKVLSFLKGKHTLICLSASKEETLIKQLKFYGIYEYFDFVVGLSDSKARSKKEVALNFKEKQNLNCNETILVGDSLHDKEVADALNVKCVLTSSGHTTKHRLLEVCDTVIDDIIELLNIVSIKSENVLKKIKH